MSRKTGKPQAQTEANAKLFEIVRDLAKIRDTQLDEKGIKPPFPFCPPEWPCEEMQVAFRYLAGQAERPQHCSNRRCRRTGVCQAGVDAPLEADCFAHWSDGDVSRLHAAWLGVVLCWMYDAERYEHFMAMALCEPTQGFQETRKKPARTGV
ncbi:hypothetical protein AB2N04_08935 [Nitratireductor sp. GISD-1A_MAKvit]|uniref:hypothetical protein n=1 Tax=Nitratireductor sp. GISD-1A_MAKvit TaxID=3234198 RepID=UPI003466E509